MLKTNEVDSIKYLPIFLLLAFISVKNNRIFGQTTIDKIHNDALVVDAHAHNLTFNNNDKQIDLTRLKEGGVDAIGLYFAYYPLKNSTLLAKVKSDIDSLQKQINSGPYHLSFASNPEQIVEIVKNGDIALVPGVEYFYGIFQNTVSVLDSLYEIGIRSITLMDNEYDILSIKNHDEKSSKALSDFGKSIIRRMNQLGMLIDISHLDDEMQRAVIKHSDCPVIASHSPVRGVHNVERNIPDDILLKLKKKNGAIMITFNSGDLAGLEEGRSNLGKLIDHIMYAINIIGVDNVGIGSDFNGGGVRSPIGLENASGFSNITYRLAEKGLSEGEIKKVLGLNYINLLKKVEEYSHE